jgi:DNA-binding transcriptional ArsR family regulator
MPEKGKLLIDQAVAWLEKRLPRGWAVESPVIQSLDLTLPPADLKISLKGPNGTTTTIAVEERQSVTPRTVLDLLSPRVQTARNMGAHLPLLVVTPWLSKRTQDLLAEQDLSYIDLTGNALLRVDNPPFYLQTMGSERNPAPKERGKAQVRGPKAARLIRLLIDVRPPYKVGELASAAGLGPGYVSRLLDTLYDEALIERSPRGPVERVDIVGLIHRWASSYDVLDTNRAEPFIAHRGIDGVLDELSNYPAEEPRFAITGSLAAVRLAPITAPTLLLAYCDGPEVLARDLGLLPASEGADVILLKPFDPVVWRRNTTESGLRFVAPAQVAIDCLTGTGRMPAEGESVLNWMTTNEKPWRLLGLPDPEAEWQ